MTKIIKMNNTKSFSAVYKYTVPESSLNILLLDKRFKDRNSYSEISREKLDQLYGFIKSLLRKKTRVDGNRILLTESQYNRLKWNALSPIGVRRYVPPVNPDSELDEENFYVIWVDEDGLFRHYGVPNMKEAKKLHDNFKSKISSGEVFNKLDIITKSELSRYEHDIEHTKNKEMNTKTFSINGTKSKRFSISKESSDTKITTEEEFREYAHNVMKNAHGDNYSEELTNKVVDDLIKDNPDADYGELIGRLTSGLGD